VRNTRDLLVAGDGTADNGHRCWLCDLTCSPRRSNSRAAKFRRTGRSTVWIFVPLSPVRRGPAAGSLCYWDNELHAVRMGAYKAHLITVELYGEGGARAEHNRPLLFNLNEDPVERSDIAAQRPEILADLQK